MVEGKQKISLLTMVSKPTLGIPIAQSKIESLFSISGFVAQRSRSSLSEQSISAIVRCKMNKDLYTFEELYEDIYKNK